VAERDIQELRRWTGHPDQVYGTRVVQVVDGPGEGVRAVEVWNAAGLRLDVLVNRGFDIHRAEYRGRALHWAGPPGLRHAHAYEPSGWGWLRSFHGGLVVTSGLEHTRLPIDRPTPEYDFPFERTSAFGLHGRIANEDGAIVARELVDGHDGPELRIAGIVAQASLYGENLELHREIRVPVFEPTIHIADTVTNRGYADTHHEFLYHINLGYPLVDAGAEVAFETSAGPIRLLATDPQPHFVEQVTTHEPTPDDDGQATVTIRNGARDFGLELRYSTATLPWLFVWYMMGQGPYVIGFEPSSMPPDSDRSLAQLSRLGPGQSMRYEATFRVLTE
jgi:hypothetical protein